MLDISKECVVYKDQKGEEEVTVNLRLSPCTVTNKFAIIIDFTKQLSEYFGIEFDKWFVNYLQKVEQNRSSLTVISEIPVMKDYVDRYFQHLQDDKIVDFSIFVDRTKAKKDSVFFELSEVLDIMRTSGYLKLYSYVSVNDNLRLGSRPHGIVYNELIKDISSTEVVTKLFNVVSTKIFRYNITDFMMWNYLKNTFCRDINVHILEIFNFIMNNILILCEPNKNPLVFFVSVVNESIRWILRSVYKSSVVFTDTILSENIQDSSLNNVKSYLYNNTIARIKVIASRYINRELENQILEAQSTMHNDNMKMALDSISQNFYKRLSKIEHRSPIIDILLLPILSDITDIPYEHLVNVPLEHLVVISAYIRKFLVEVFGSDYETMFYLMGCYPLTAPPTTTTYQLKNVTYFIEKQAAAGNFCTFNTKMYPYGLISQYVGRVSRISFVNILNGDLFRPQTKKLEEEMVDFYTKYFAGGFKREIDQVGNLLMLEM